MRGEGSVIITGATGGIGSVATRALAGIGVPVIMACRNIQKAAVLRADILSKLPEARLEILPLDLGSFDSVRNFAESVKGPVAGLFNNAGIICRDWNLTRDGYELSLQTNFLSPCLLTHLLMPAMTGDSVVVNMVSLTCRYARFGRDLFVPDPGKFSQLGTYATSKLALLLYSVALSSKTGLRVNMADPGVVNSGIIAMGRWFDPLADLLFRPFIKSPEKGAIPAMNALGSTSGGRFFKGRRELEVPERYLHHKDLDWLWEESGKRLKLG